MRERIVTSLVTAFAAVGLSLWPAAATAQDDPVPYFYGGILGGVVLPDSVRDAESAVGATGLAAIGVAEGVAFELSVFGTQTERRSDGRDDQSVGVGLDLALGLPEPGSLLFLLGGGAIREDFKGLKTVTSGFGSIGVGAYLPFSFFGELWRLEGRYHAVFNDETFPTTEIVEDLRFNLGVVFGQVDADAFRDARADSDGDGVPNSEDHCPTSPAGARVDFSGCEIDSDLDGIPDTADRCPGTAAGVTVDATGCEDKPDADLDGVADDVDQCPGTPRWVRPLDNGCTPDHDGDGVDETLDRCPDTPKGTAVDESGCVPGTLVMTGGDEDQDGVLNAADACPHTPRFAPVDARGCVQIDQVITDAVLFELNSDNLRPKGYRLLQAIAAALNAVPQTRIEIGGHTDDTGPHNFNLRLSKERAQVVADFLSYLDIESGRMKVVGFGETKPIADNATEGGREKNRRVEFRLLP